MTTRTPPRDDGEVDLLAQYCREVARYQVLDAFTAATLAQLAQGGDKLARTDLVNAYLWLVVEVAKSYHRGHRQHEMMDLISIGNLKLLTCVDGYADDGRSFQAYAAVCLRNGFRDLGRHAAANGRDKTLPLFEETEVAIYEDPRESVEAQVERELADEQTMALLAVVLSKRECYFVQRLAGLIGGPADAKLDGKITTRDIAAELGLHRQSGWRLLRDARTKLAPYLQALHRDGSGPVLSSVARALEPPGKRTPPLSLMAGTNGANAADTTHADLVMVTTAPDQLPQSAATQPNRLPSKSVRRRQQSGPIPISASNGNTARRGRSNATEKKTA